MPKRQADPTQIADESSSAKKIKRSSEQKDHDEKKRSKFKSISSNWKALSKVKQEGNHD